MIRIICTECKNAYLQNKGDKYICPSCGYSTDSARESFLWGVQLYNEGNYADAQNHLMSYIVKFGAVPDAIFYKALCDAAEADEDTLSIEEYYGKILGVLPDFSEEAFPAYIALANDEAEKIEKKLGEIHAKQLIDADAEKIKHEVTILIDIRDKALKFRNDLRSIVSVYNEKAQRKLSVKFSDCYLITPDIAREVGDAKYNLICEKIASRTVFTGILANDIKYLKTYYSCIVMFFESSRDKYKFLLEQAEKFVSLDEILKEGQYNTIKDVARVSDKLKLVAYDFLTESYSEHNDENIESQTETVVILEPEATEAAETETDVEAEEAEEATESEAIIEEETEAEDTIAEEETVIEAPESEEETEIPEDASENAEETEVITETAPTEEAQEADETAGEAEEANEAKATEATEETTEDVSGEAADNCLLENEDIIEIDSVSEEVVTEDVENITSTSPIYTSAVFPAYAPANNNGPDTNADEKAALEGDTLTGEELTEISLDIEKAEAEANENAPVAEDTAVDSNTDSEEAASDEDTIETEEKTISDGDTILVGSLSEKDDATITEISAEEAEATEEAEAETTVEKSFDVIEIKEEEPLFAPRPQKKKNRKPLVLLLLVIVLAGVVLGFKHIPGIISEKKYEAAVALVEEEKFAQAAEAFKELGNYEDSREKATECIYNNALALEEEKKYDEAKELYASLGDYLDCSTRIQSCTYSQARAALEAGEYDSAAKLFDAIKDYGDSKTMLKECSYKKALILMEAEKYEAAIDAFSKIKKYSDAQEKIRECKYFYVTKNLDKDNKTTVKFLDQLTKAEYRNSADLRKELLGSAEVLPTESELKAFVNYDYSDLENALTELDSSRKIYFHVVFNDDAYYGKTVVLRYTTEFGYSQKETVTVTQENNAVAMLYPATYINNYTVTFECTDSDGTKLAETGISF